MEIGFTVEGAKPKKTGLDEDAPTQAPMAPRGGSRRSPSTDQIKVRRQIAKSASTLNEMFYEFRSALPAATNLEIQDVWETTSKEVDSAIPGVREDMEKLRVFLLDEMRSRGIKPLGSKEAASDFNGNGMLHALWIAIKEWLVGNAGGYSDYADQYAFGSLKESTMESTSLDRAIAAKLAAMPTASLADQQRLAQEIVDLKARRTAMVHQDREVDFGAMGLTTEAALPFARHSNSTDWLGDEDVDDEAVMESQRSMSAQASKWYLQVSASVKADPQEFEVQARGMATTLASAHGANHAIAADAFLRYAMFLNRGGQQAVASLRTTASDYDLCETCDHERRDHEGVTGPCRACEGDESGDVCSGFRDYPEGEREPYEAKVSVGRAVTPAHGAPWIHQPKTAGDNWSRVASDNEAPPTHPWDSEAGEADDDQTVEGEVRIDTPPADVPFDTFGAPIAPENAAAVAQEGERTPMTGAGEGDSKTASSIPWCRRCGEAIEKKDGQWLSLEPRGGRPPHVCSEDAALINFNSAPKGHRPKKVASVHHSRTASSERPCEACQGGGVFGDSTCYRCLGTGVDPGTRTAALSDSDKSKIMTPGSREITKDQAKALCEQGNDGSGRSLCYAYWNDQIVGIKSMYYFDRYKDDAEFFWVGSGKGIWDSITQASKTAGLNWTENTAPAGRVYYRAAKNGYVLDVRPLTVEEVGEDGVWGWSTTGTGDHGPKNRYGQAMNRREAEMLAEGIADGGNFTMESRKTASLGIDGGYVLPVEAETNPEYPTRCTNCNRPVQALSVFPGGLCIDCHAAVTPFPTAQDVVESWGGTWHESSKTATNVSFAIKDGEGKVIYTHVFEGEADEIIAKEDPDGSKGYKKVPQTGSFASKTAASQAEFDADMTKLNEALKPWVIDFGDGTHGLDPSAPEALTSAYQRLQQYGYANGLMDKYASKTAGQFVTMDLGPGLGVTTVEGPWELEYDATGGLWYVYGLIGGLNTTMFTSPSKAEVDAWVADHPMTNPDAGEQMTLASRKTADMDEANTRWIEFIEGEHNSGGHKWKPNCHLCRNREEESFRNDPAFRETPYGYVQASKTASDKRKVEVYKDGDRWSWDIIDPLTKTTYGRGTADSEDAARAAGEEALSKSAGVKTAKSFDDAVLEHAQSQTGTIKPGDVIDGNTVTEVGTHTIQYTTNDGYSGSRQIPFVDGWGNKYPSLERAEKSASSVPGKVEGEVNADANINNSDEMWPWTLPDGDVNKGEGAADVASTPTPGGESGYPQPKTAADTLPWSWGQKEEDALRQRIQQHKDAGRPNNDPSLPYDLGYLTDQDKYEIFGGRNLDVIDSWLYRNNPEGFKIFPKRSSVADPAKLNAFRDRVAVRKHANVDWGDGVVGKVMIGFPGSEILSVEPTAGYLINGPVTDPGYYDDAAGGMVTYDFDVKFRMADGREVTIGKTYDWLQKRKVR